VVMSFNANLHPLHPSNANYQDPMRVSNANVTTTVASNPKSNYIQRPQGKHSQGKRPQGKHSQGKRAQQFQRTQGKPQGKRLQGQSLLQTIAVKKDNSKPNFQGSGTIKKRKVDRHKKAMKNIINAASNPKIIGSNAYFVRLTKGKLDMKQKPKQFTSEVPRVLGQMVNDYVYSILKATSFVSINRGGKTATKNDVETTCLVRNESVPQDYSIY